MMKALLLRVPLQFKTPLLLPTYSSSPMEGEEVLWHNEARLMVDESALGPPYIDPASATENFQN
jgi:hypothetical protein